MKYYIVFFILSIHCHLSAQRTVTDSLLSLINHAPTLLEKAEMHLTIAEENQILDAALAKYHAESALAIGQQVQDNSIIGKGYKQIGIIEDYKYKYPSTFNYLDSALHFLALAKDTANMKRINLVYARAYCHIGECEKGIDTYNQSEVGVDKTTIDFHRIRVNHIICLQNCRFYERCVELCDLTLPYAQQLQDSIWQMYYHLLRGNSLVQTGHPELALESFDNALATLTVENLPVYKGGILNNRAEAYEALNYLEKAKSDYTVGIAHNIEYGMAEDNSRAYISLGAINKKLGDYPESQRYFLRGIKELYKNKDYTIIADTHIMLAELLAEMNEPDSAFQNVMRAYKLRDSVFTEEVRIKTEELNIRYETERVKRELAQSNLQIQIEQNQRRLTIVAGLGMLFLGIAIGTYLVFRQRQKRLQIEKRKIELEYGLLRAQMNPHFVFNSLNSIQGYFANNDFKAGNQFLGKFSRLIRRVLDQSTAKEVSLGEELETLKLYLELEALRLKNRLDYEFHYPSDLEIDLIYVPPLILQPFVENAIWHGIAPKQGKGKIDIYLKTNAAEDRLLAKVEDDGIGLKIHKNTDHQSRGVQITRERLGEESSVEIANRRDGNGVSVALEFPISV